jgi:hypothetical protein
MQRNNVILFLKTCVRPGFARFSQEFSLKQYCIKMSAIIKYMACEEYYGIHHLI